VDRVVEDDAEEQNERHREESQEMRPRVFISRAGNGALKRNVTMAMERIKVR